MAPEGSTGHAFRSTPHRARCAQLWLWHGAETKRNMKTHSAIMRVSLTEEDAPLLLRLARARPLESARWKTGPRRRCRPQAASITWFGSTVTFRDRRAGFGLRRSFPRVARMPSLQEYGHVSAVSYTVTVHALKAWARIAVTAGTSIPTRVFLLQHPKSPIVRAMSDLQRKFQI